MIARARHIDDERLLDCYVAERTGEPGDPRLDDHLAECQTCAGRYEALAQFMDGVRAEADIETAAVFTPERLRLQQRQIAERIERTLQPAHVLSFPKRVGGHMASASRVAPRWIAGAAAAGLFVGMGAGLFLNSGPRGTRLGRPRAAEVAAAPSPTVAAPAPAALPVLVADSAAQPATDDVDVFLSELDIALERPRTHELLPFDEFTPHVSDISTRLR